MAAPSNALTRNRDNFITTPFSRIIRAFSCDIAYSKSLVDRGGGGSVGTGGRISDPWPDSFHHRVWRKVRQRQLLGLSPGTIPRLRPGGADDHWELGHATAIRVAKNVSGAGERRSLAGGRPRDLFKFSPEAGR